MCSGGVWVCCSGGFGIRFVGLVRDRGWIRLAMELVLEGFPEQDNRGCRKTQHS